MTAHILDVDVCVYGALKYWKLVIDRLEHYELGKRPKFDLKDQDLGVSWVFWNWIDMRKIGKMNPIIMRNCI